ncbi:rhodanese-like/PpiC domain-containing protein 12-like [Dorcoceras hygrometricum]|uniref:Peptidyl-prolyl cis-trans isomerase n=1 Tax=Dorcoceras hygrometricum TaxID=472368 RepID=A0A2Z7D6E4_9LAMI|nr:rhodanese-like/PpiC domain-containing protein 12-like [Dorcoceras hygrometricum]
MLRASYCHLSPSVFTAPSPLFALLPTLTTNHKSFPIPQAQTSQSIFHRRNRVLPVYRLNFGGFSSKLCWLSGMTGQCGIPKAAVKEDDQKLLLELQKRAAEGEDLGDLAVEYSICPSKEEGGMLGWVRRGQMVPEFEEAAFAAPLNKIIRCKTKFGWHLLQVLSEREESVLENIQPVEFHEKMQNPEFLKDAQLIDVREPDEVFVFLIRAKASLPGFKVLSLRQFGSWAPEILTKFDPQVDTYVLCHHGMRSLQVAKWLQTQGFRRVYNLSGGIHEYAVKADPSVPTY